MQDKKTNMLLVFLIVLGIIVWSVLQKKLNSQVINRDSTRKEDLTRAVAALEEYKKIHGYYPDKLETVGTFKDPVSVLSYTYITNKNKTKFKILATLENRKDKDWLDLEDECGAVRCSWGLASGAKVTDAFDKKD